MTQYKIEIVGAGIVDKHTHYEAYPFISSERATVIISGGIATQFQEEYGLPITEAGRLQITVDVGRNDQRVKECQDAFKPASHLMGAVHSLDDVVYTKENVPKR